MILFGKKVHLDLTYLFLLTFSWQNAVSQVTVFLYRGIIWQKGVSVIILFTLLCIMQAEWCM